MRPDHTDAAGGRKKRRLRAWRGRREGAPALTPLGDALLALLEGMGGSPERAGLQGLWDNWETVLGPELAGLARPLGSHAPGKKGGAAARGGAILLIGAGDAMLLQELRFRGGDILERVNAFLGTAYFCEVKVSLPMGRRKPERSRPAGRAPAADEAPGAPAARGVFLAGMDPDSPVARCYARFTGARSGDGEKAAKEHEERWKK